VQKLDESIEARLLEKEYEREHGDRRVFARGQEVAVSCLLAIALTAFCFLSVFVIRACWSTGPR
jgi:hypothetical protein